MPNFLGLQCYLVLGSFPVVCPGVENTFVRYTFCSDTRGGKLDSICTSFSCPCQAVSAFTGPTYFLFTLCGDGEILEELLHLPMSALVSAARSVSFTEWTSSERYAQ